MGGKTGAGGGPHIYYYPLECIQLVEVREEEEEKKDEEKW
jgi:hypothetical protein